MKNEPDPDPAALLEVYKQAHETRRRWEAYIWQWGILLTVLGALFVRWSEPVVRFSLQAKLVLTLVSSFVVVIFFNVLRARVLMKAIEDTIRRIHVQLRVKFPVVPTELDLQLPRITRISSTKLAVICHFLAALVFIAVTVFAWLSDETLPK